MKNLKYIILIICLSITSFAFGQAKHYILALSKTDKKLVVLDYNTFDIIAKIPVGDDPHEIVTSPDGKIAYVSNTGSGRFHTINVIDLKTLTVLDSIDTSPLLGPHGLAFADNKVWFTTQGTKTIGRFDPIGKKIDLVLGTGQDRTHMLKVTNDGKQIYATNVGSGTVSIYDYILFPPTITPMGYALPTAKPYWDWIQTVIPVAENIEGLDISPNGKEIWTASPITGKIYIIDIATKKISQTIDAHIFGANRIRFTSDNKYVLISSLKTGDLLIYDTLQRKQIKRLNVGTGASEVLIDNDNSRAFIACTPDNYIAVIDLKTFEITKHISIGGRPDGLTFAKLN